MGGGCNGSPSLLGFKAYSEDYLLKSQGQQEQAPLRFKAYSEDYLLK